MKNKLLAILLSLCMIFALLPVTAMADGETDVSNETDLKTALTNGGSIKLTGNITLTDTITISSGTIITLDLANYTITGKAGADGTSGSDALAVTGGTLTITDSSDAKTGKVVGGNGGDGSSGDSGGSGGKGGAALAVTSGTVNINGGSFKGGNGGRGGTGGGGEGEGAGGGEGASGDGGHALYIEGGTVNINGGGFFQGGEGKSGSDNGNAWRGNPTLVNCAVKRTGDTLITVLHSAADYAAAAPAANNAQASGDYWLDEANTTLHIYNAKGAAWWSASGATYLGYTVLLEDDIDVSDFLWTPVGTASAFTGTFDGQGHTIGGLTMNITGSDSEIHAGLFGLNSGTVKNLSITGSNVKANSTSQSAYAGGIAGQNNGTISNCSVTGNISATGSTSANAGGVIGYISSSGTVANCYSTAAVTAADTATGTNAYAGGVAGYNGSGSIGYCYWLKAIGTNVNFAGGGNYSATACYSFENASSEVNYNCAEDAGRDILIPLCDALNSWVSAQASTTYNTWAADSNVNGGYPVFGAASITGLTLSTNAPAVGTPITATVAPAGATASYQWYLNATAAVTGGTAIRGATNASYTPASADEGKYLYCVATGTGNYSGTASAVTTTAVAANSSPSTGGGSSTPSTPVTTLPSSGSVPVSATISGGTAKVTMPQAQLETALEGGETEVTVDLSGKTDVKSIELPAKTLQTIGEAGAAVTIKTANGSVTLDAATLKGLSDAAGGKAVTLTIAPIDIKVLSKSDKGMVGTRPALTLTAAIGAEMVKNFDGSVTVTVPYEKAADEKAEGLCVWFLDGGKISKMPAKYDHETKAIAFTTPHFSTYVIGYFPFEDVSEDAWYYGDAAYAYINGLFAGTSETAFSPDMPMTRAMLVTVLYRLEGEPAVNQALPPFTDAQDGGWFINGLNWAYGAKLVSGYDDGSFGVNDPVTREQLVAILYRYAKYKSMDVSVGEDTNILSYDDAFDIAEYAIPAMQWACGAGIVSGSGTALMPQGSATRAQVAAMLHRFAAEAEA